MNPLLRDITEGIRARPGRAGLSLLALAVGMTALTVLLAVLGGLEVRSRQIVAELGANVFAVTAPPPGEDTTGRGRLRPSLVTLLDAALPGADIAATRRFEGPAGNANRAVQIIAAHSALARVRQWTVQAGRFLDEEDERQLERAAVASAALATEEGWAVGDTILLRQTPFRLIGILARTAGASLDGDDEPALAPGSRTLWVPFSTPAYWVSARVEPELFLDALYVRAPPGMDPSTAAIRAGRVLDSAEGRPAYALVTPDTLLKKVRRLQHTIQLTVGSIAALCILLGGTTLMSLMVANVRDRVTEIGLRRALGATRGDIAALFVWEGLLVTVVAALLGSGLTHAALALAHNRLPVPIALGWITVLAPAALALLLGAVFSYAPARAAARVVPAEALRND